MQFDHETEYQLIIHPECQAYDEAIRDMIYDELQLLMLASQAMEQARRSAKTAAHSCADQGDHQARQWDLQVAYALKSLCTAQRPRHHRYAIYEAAFSVQRALGIDLTAAQRGAVRDVVRNVLDKHVATDGRR